MTTEADAPHQRRDRGHGPLGQAQGRPALHPRPGRVHRRRQPARPALARHRPQPVRPRHDQGHRRHRGAQDPGRPRGHHRRRPREGRAPLDADPRRRQADGAPDRHRHVPVAGGRRGRRDDQVHRGRRRRRGHGRLRAAAGHRRPAQGARARRVRAPARPRPGQAEQPHLALGIGRRGRRRRRARRGRGPGRRGHLHPAHPRRVDRDVRLRRRLGRRPRPADPAHDEPGAARHPDRARPRAPACPEQNIRVKTHDIGGGFGGKVPVYPGYVLAVVASPDRRQAGQVDRGPLGEPPGRLVRPRLPHPRRAGRDQGRQDHRPQGQDDRRPRLHRRRRRPVQVPGRPVQRHHRLVRLPERVRRGRRRLHEQAARRRRLPLLVPGDRGGPRHRADGRHPRPRHRQGPGPAPDGELHPARAVPVQDADRLVVRLGQLRAGAPEGDGHDRLRRPPQGAGSRSASAASSWASASAASPRSSAPGRRTTSTSSGSRCSTSCEIRVHPTGKVLARIGVQTQGQGHETTFAQIIAEELGFPVQDIKIEYGDTDTAPYGLGTYASRSTPVAGAADRDGVAQDPGQGAQARRAPARGVRGRPRVGARQVQRQGLARPVQDDPGDRVRGLHELSRRGWRWASRRSTTTTRRT